MNTARWLGISRPLMTVSAVLAMLAMITLTAPSEVGANDNSPATGTPTISGTAEVGQTLTVDTSGIADENGLTNVSYGGAWYANESGVTSSGGTLRVLIAAGASLSYTVQSGDAGKTLKIQVTFTDDAGNEESRTSASTAVVPTPTTGPATGMLTFDGTFLVGETLEAVTRGISDPDGLTNVSYSYQWISNDGTTDTDIDGATDSTYTLQVSDAGKRIKLRVTFTDDASNDESLTTAASPKVVARNFRATGVPTISGTAQVGLTLTASTSGIADANGLTNVSYSYQWISNDGATDSEIAGATNSNYTLQTTDNGKTIKVQVTFTDDQDFSESLTSAGTSAVVMGGL